MIKLQSSVGDGVGCEQLRESWGQVKSVARVVRYRYIYVYMYIQIDIEVETRIVKYTI